MRQGGRPPFLPFGDSTSQACKGIDTPTEQLGKEGRYEGGCIDIAGDKAADQLGTIRAEQVAHGGADEGRQGNHFGRQAVSEGDDHHQRQGQNRQRHIIDIVGQTAQNGDGGVGQGKEVYQGRRG